MRGFAAAALGVLPLGLGLFFCTGYYLWPTLVTSMMTDYYPEGFPFAIRATGLCPAEGVCQPFSWPAFVGDLVVWTLVAVVIILMVDPYFKRKQQNSNKT